jgi:hypothetical protein
MKELEKGIQRMLDIIHNEFYNIYTQKYECWRQAVYSRNNNVRMRLSSLVDLELPFWFAWYLVAA